jgi:cardiolipin synthase C
VIFNRILVFLFIIVIGTLPLVANSNEISSLDGGIEPLSTRLALLEDPNTKSVDFSTYELVYDEAGKTFIAALIRAAERGVKVRGIIDRRIAKANPMLIHYLNEYGIEIKFYNPITLRFWDVLTRPVQLFRRFNSRLHDKIFIVNSEVLVLGDKNYGNKYYNQFNFLPEKSFYTSGKEVLLQGDGVTEYLDYFNSLWSDRNEVARADSVPKIARLTLTDKWREEFNKIFMPYKHWVKKRTSHFLNILERYKYDQAEVIIASDGKSALMKIFEKIRNAEPGSRVLIENAYFVMFPELRETLKAAIANGVEITVNLNFKPDKWIVGQAFAMDLKEIADLGVKIFLNRDVPTHGKLILIQRPNGNKEVIVTSANFDPRSFRINNESGLSVRSADLYDHYQNEFEGKKSNMINASKVSQCARVYMGKQTLPRSSFLGRQAVKVMRPQL